MDTTAAAELAVGMPGPGVDGVGFWVGANTDQDAWSEDEYERTPEIGTSRNLDRPDWGKATGRRYHERLGRPPPLGTDPPHKRMRNANGDVTVSHSGNQAYGGRLASGDYSSGSAHTLNNYRSAYDYDNGAGFQCTRATNGYAPGMGGGSQTQGSMRGSNSLSGETDSVLESSNPASSGGGGSVAVSSASKGKGTGGIFFKTKLCCKFRAGTCPYNSNCNFAHGMEELRKPPPGWEEIVAAQEAERALRGSREGQVQLVVEPTGSGPSGDAQRFHKTPRPCRKYYTDEGCPYGERCIFLHDDQGSQTRMLRESNAISLGPTTSTMNGVGNGGSSTERPISWKTRVCNKWETTGHCPFGQKCHFVHGTSDGHLVPSSTRHAGTIAASLQFQRQGLKSLPKWKGPADEISTIYGDWIEEDEWENNPILARNGTSQQVSHVKELFHDVRKDVKAEVCLESNPQNQLHVPFFQGKKGHDGSGQRESTHIGYPSTLNDSGLNLISNADTVGENGWDREL